MLNDLPIIAAVDRPFLDAFRQGFTRGYDTALLWQYVAWVLTAVLVLLSVGLAYRFVMRFFTHHLQPGWIFNQKEIQAILQQALDQRSKFDVQFLPAEDAHRSIPCAFTSYREDLLELEASGLEQITKRWLGKPVECYFKIIDRKKRRPCYFRFNSQIIGVARDSDGLTKLLIEYPPALEMRQKRDALRFEPSPDLIAELALWPARQAAPDGRPISDVRTLGEPPYHLVHGKGQGIRLDNLSAGGVKLLLAREHYKDCVVCFAVGSPFLLHLELVDPEVEQTRSFWFFCRVKNSFDDFQNHHLETGLKFVFHGIPGKDAPHLLTWRTVSEDGHDDIANWVMKRHLAQHRHQLTT